MEKIEPGKDNFAKDLYMSFTSKERIWIMSVLRPKPAGFGLDLPKLNNLINKISEYKKENNLDEVSYSELGMLIKNEKLIQ